MKRGYLLTTLAILSLLLVVVGTNVGCAPAAEKENVLKYANINAFSGAAASWGWMIQYSIEVAAEDINAAGGVKVGGESYKVEVPKYDHAFDPTVTGTVFRKAVYDDKIHYMSVMGGGMIPAINDLAQKEKVIIQGAAAGSAWLGPKWPYTFRNYTSCADSLDVLLEYLVPKYPEARTILLALPDNSLGREYAELMPAVAKRHGIEAVDILWCEYGMTDFYPALTALFAKYDVDILDLGPTSPGVQGLILKQARELGYTGLVISSDSTDVPTVADIAGMEALEGHITAPQWVEFPTDVGKKWAERFIARYGSMQAFTGMMYDGLIMLAAAMEEANSLDPEKVVKALETIRISGAYGETFYGGKELYGIDCAVIIEIGVVEIIGGEQVDVYRAIPSQWRK